MALVVETESDPGTWDTVRMSPMSEDRLAKIREQLNAGQAISLDDSRFLLLSIDRLLLLLRQRTADDLKDEAKRAREVGE
jgi:hypothetical protein